MNPYQLPPAGHESPAKRWLQTAVAAVAATGLLVLAFFFAVFALVAAVLLIAVVAARWWWLTRRLRRAAREADTVVEGEYRVVERGSRDHDAPPGGRG
jgi:Flp pilus assembly protein TadB